LVVKHQVCDISSIVMTRTSLKIINRADKRWSRNGFMDGCFRSIYCIIKTNGSHTICIQLDIVFSKMHILYSSRRCVLDKILCDKVCQWLATGRLFSTGTPVSSTIKLTAMI